MFARIRSVFTVRVITLAIAVVLAISPANSLATNRYWQDTGIDNWNDPSNWSGSSVPGTSDDAYINNAGTAVINSDAGAIRRLLLGNAASESGYLEIESGGSLETTIGHHTYYGIVVGEDGTGSVLQKAGDITLSGTSATVGALCLAYDTGSSGTYEIRDGTLTLNAWIGVARLGTGTFIQKGGVVTSNYAGGALSVGSRHFDNRYLMSGGELNLPNGTMTVGSTAGWGSFIQTGGDVTIGIAGGDGLMLAQSRAGDTSEGLYEISGGSLDVTDSAIRVGVQDVGTFRVIGSGATKIEAKGYSQNSQSALEFVMDSAGVTPITIDDSVSLDGNLNLDLSLLGSPLPTIVLIDNGGSDPIGGDFINNPIGTNFNSPAGLYLLTNAHNAGADGNSNDLALSYSRYGSTVLDDAPVAYWRLGEQWDNSANEPAFDAANDYDGTYHNGVLTRQMDTGLMYDIDTAAYFDGQNDYIDVAYSADLNPAGSFSVEAWAKADDPSESGSYSLLSSRSDGPRKGYFLYNSNGKWSFGTGNGSGWDFLSPGPDVEDRWTHVVATFEATSGPDGLGAYTGTATLYIDGVAVVSESGHKYAPITASNEFRIGAGRNEGTPSYYFEGWLDEVAVYGDYLTADKVMAHYQAAIPEPASLVLLVGGVVCLLLLRRRKA